MKPTNKTNGNINQCNFRNCRTRTSAVNNLQKKSSGVEHISWRKESFFSSDFAQKMFWKKQPNKLPHYIQLFKVLSCCPMLAVLCYSTLVNFSLFFLFHSLLLFFSSRLVFLASFLSALLYIYRFSVFFAVHCAFISLMSATHLFFILLCCNVSLVVFHLRESMCGCGIVNLAVISLNVECSWSSLFNRVGCRATSLETLVGQLLFS